MTPKNPPQPWRALQVMTETQATALLASATQISQWNIGVFLIVTNDAGVFQALYLKTQQGSTPSVFQQVFTAESVELDADQCVVTDGDGNVLCIPYTEMMDRLVTDANAMRTTQQQTAQRTAVSSGTVAQINGGTAPFNAPITGQMAFCTNATGGAKPCWYNGTNWVTADGVILA